MKTLQANKDLNEWAMSVGIDPKLSVEVARQKAIEHLNISDEYYNIDKNPDKYWSAKSRKGVALDLSTEHQKAGNDLNAYATAKEELINKNTQITKTSKTMDKNVSRVLTQDTKIGEKTFKKGTKFVVESIKYCKMKIKIGKAVLDANLNLVKDEFSSPATV